MDALVETQKSSAEETTKVQAGRGGGQGCAIDDADHEGDGRYLSSFRAVDWEDCKC